MSFCQTKTHSLYFQFISCILQFELLDLDIWGPLSVSSLLGHKYFLTIIDDHSRFLWIILLKSKDGVAHQFHVTPKFVRSDNGPEFMLFDFYASHGIIHQKSCVETPQQNFSVERKHQHILNVGRAFLFQSKLPSSYWSYAILHAVFSLIESLLLYFKINPLFRFYTINYLIFPFSKCLVVCVMLHIYKFIELNCNTELENPFF